MDFMNCNRSHSRTLDRCSIFHVTIEEIAKSNVPKMNRAIRDSMPFPSVSGRRPLGGSTLPPIGGRGCVPIHP